MLLLLAGLVPMAWVLVSVGGQLGYGPLSFGWALLLGVDAAPMTLARAARRLGLELDEAKKLNARWLKLVKSSPKIAALTAHIENIEENLP